MFAGQFERVLPASSVANMYPLNYSGKTDENGFYLGRDKFGSNILVDFDKRTNDKTNSNILILGNSGQGKSYLIKLYARFEIDDFTDFDKLESADYPIISDLYELIEKEFLSFDNSRKHLYTEEILQNICLGLYSMCKGVESKYFDGHTNIRDGKFICFGVKGLMDTNKRLKDTLLFNILSYMSNQLLGKGNTVAAVDELYLFLTNMTAIEYI